MGGHVHPPKGGRGHAGRLARGLGGRGLLMLLLLLAVQAHSLGGGRVLGGALLLLMLTCVENINICSCSKTLVSHYFNIKVNCPKPVNFCCRDSTH